MTQSQELGRKSTHMQTDEEANESKSRHESWLDNILCLFDSLNDNMEYYQVWHGQHSKENDVGLQVYHCKLMLSRKEYFNPTKRDIKFKFKNPESQMIQKKILMYDKLCWIRGDIKKNMQTKVLFFKKQKQKTF